MAATSPQPPFSGAPDHRTPAARPRAVARLVDPLIADALALERLLDRCPPPEGSGHPAPPLFAVFADQLRAAAALMDGCVGATERGARAPRADARPGATPPADDVPDPLGDPPGDPLGDPLGRLLDGEARMARHLRRAIAACDRRADDRTADRLEEVLDEVERQRWLLSALLPKVAG